MDRRHKGRITQWNDARGFGFVTPLNGDEQVFIHVSAFANRARRPEAGEIVSYTLGSDRRGRTCATRATLAGDRPAATQTRRSGRGSVIAALLFLGLLGLGVLLQRVPPALLGVYLLASLLTFALYAFDKSAARRERRRTPEKTLHLAALLGGWPGALLAQQQLRHKTQKATFRRAFWGTVMLNLGALLWLQAPGGIDALAQVLRQL